MYISHLRNLRAYIYIYMRHQCATMSSTYVGTWWRIGWVDSFQPEGRGFDSRSRRHVGTLGKSLTHSCLWRFGVKLRHSIRAVSGALLSRSELEEKLLKWSEWMKKEKQKQKQKQKQKPRHMKAIGKSPESSTSPFHRPYVYSLLLNWQRMHEAEVQNSCPGWDLNFPPHPRPLDWESSTLTLSSTS